MNANRSARDIISEPTLSDLTSDDEWGIMDRLVAQEAMSASRSGSWKSSKKPSKNSKPIGKKHYHKATNHTDPFGEEVTYRPTNQVDRYGRTIWLRNTNVTY